MTLVQLEYVIAVDTFRHFAKAAEHCFVTQPTLSMQLLKLEHEFGVQIFDRSKQPVVATEAGLPIIAHARAIIAKRDMLTEHIQDRQGLLSGELKIGIIPTLAPYLLPLFITAFAKKYPLVKLSVTEMTTETIIVSLRTGRIDAGILVTPLHETGIRERVLFYEELIAYVSKKNSAYKKSYVLAKDIDPGKLWLMEEGHCFRSQIVNLCELRKVSKENSHFEYEAGSVETLKKMVELNDGITILPELATIDMLHKQTTLLRHFRKPAPMREVSIVLHRDFVKKKLVDALQLEIIKAIPDKIKRNGNSHVVSISHPD